MIKNKKILKIAKVKYIIKGILKKIWKTKGVVNESIKKIIIFYKEKNQITKKDLDKPKNMQKNLIVLDIKK